MNPIFIYKILAALIMTILILFLIGRGAEIIYSSKKSSQYTSSTILSESTQDEEKATIETNSSNNLVSENSELLALIDTADPQDSVNLRIRCLSCHTFGEGESNRVGPNLWNIVGRPIASVPGFTYSESLQRIEGTWSLTQLDLFLTNPQKFAKGTRMNYFGISDARLRSSILSYLRSMNNNFIADN